MKQAILYVARHGQTTLNAKNCFRGLANPDLDATGRRDAQALADFFEPIELGAIFYSSKNRSTETAEAVASRKPGIVCYPCDSLWPLNVGFLSGQKKSKENVDKLECYIQHPDLPIPDGESLNHFKARVRPCLKEGMDIANQYGKPVLFVVHSSIVHEVGEMINNSHYSTLVEPGGACAVYFDGKKLFAEAVLKPDTTSDYSKPDTVS